MLIDYFQNSINRGKKSVYLQQLLTGNRKKVNNVIYKILELRINNWDTYNGNKSCFKNKFPNMHQTIGMTSTTTTSSVRVNLKGFNLFYNGNQRISF